MEYTALRLKKEKEGSVVVTSNSFSIFTKHVPFRLVGEAKKVYSNDWNDEDGFDTYTNEEDGLKMEAYEMEVAFIYRGKLSEASNKIRTFIDYLTGKDKSGVMLQMYDDYYKIGRQHVRFVKADDTATVMNDIDDNVLVEFRVTFSVDDPSTDIVLSL